MHFTHTPEAMYLAWYIFDRLTHVALATPSKTACPLSFSNVDSLALRFQSHPMPFHILNQFFNFVANADTGGDVNCKHELFEAVNLFHLVINPLDFRQSVESIYHLSFLIRNGTCALRVADNENPMVCQAVPPTHQEHANGVNRTQMIMDLEFSMATGDGCSGKSVFSMERTTNFLGEPCVNSDDVAGNVLVVKHAQGKKNQIIDCDEVDIPWLNGIMRQ
ncbi:hypothetical protein F4604DRAFT_1681818 [Suillus subluteus]|nr:hypothetical protein F4604DRAFT_1681818 [Suillus subluteus]